MFVISGYLITTIIITELKANTFSIANFYERRARRILPALFLVMLTCIPFAWFWLLPKDMNEFVRSITATVTFSSNYFFLKQSGYFEIVAELKPLLHTWSLAVEEQYYIIFPLILMFTWKLGTRKVLQTLAVLFVASLIGAQISVLYKPEEAFFSFPTRGWELLVGSFVAFYLFHQDLKVSSFQRQLGAMIGLSLICFSMFTFDDQTLFPGVAALPPTIGTAMIILFATPGTFTNWALSLRPLVAIGLISYSAYLWHQPLFAFTRYQSLQEPSNAAMFALFVLTFVLAFLTWYFVEKPFRSKNTVKLKPLIATCSSIAIILIAFGLIGKQTKGYANRFDLASLPAPWENIKCHGRRGIAGFENPLDECLSGAKNNKPGDIFLIGDSHAAQLTFPLKRLMENRNKNLFFINTEGKTEFPKSFWKDGIMTNDRILDHVIKVSDPGDYVVIALYHERLNDNNSQHIPLEIEVKMNNLAQNYLSNLSAYMPKFKAAGLRLFLVNDTPMLPSANLERCAFYNKTGSSNPCEISRLQAEHTRTRLSLVYKELEGEFVDFVTLIDPMPVLFDGQQTFNPINEDGSYKMFDQHHLTEPSALSLYGFFERTIKP
ncbi:MAG: acyltransferase family protein [Salaquimonas sp.]